VFKKALIFMVILFGTACQKTDYDLLIVNGLVMDGSGQSGFRAEIAIKDGRIVAISDSIQGIARKIIDAKEQIVCPGFIDMLSWACGPVLYHGDVPSVIRQGITTVIFGEGWSMGPLNKIVRKEMKGFWPEYKIRYKWNTLADYLRLVEEKGTAVNVASFVGATTLRVYTVGFEDRPATADEMKQMEDLLRVEMEAGALGLGSSLVYTPAFYAGTDELVNLARIAAEYGGIYISHLRSESTDLLKAITELVTISEKANIPAEIYHFKAAGKFNWDKQDSAIALVEQSRSRGLDISADMYPYTAGATGLSAMIPPWAKERGDESLVNRLQNPDLRARIKNEILNSVSGWENFYRMAGGGENILISYLSGTRQILQGKTLSAIARQNQQDDLEALFDLLIAEKGGGGGIYFLMSEENVRKNLQRPWMSFCTDEDAYQPEGLMGKRRPHPRAYGTFPRILGQYVRDEKILIMDEAIRKMTSLPASRVGLKDRGLLKPGFAADVVIFDPATVNDNATYTNPHQFPTGINYVVVNGVVEVENGKQTGAQAGKALLRNGYRARGEKK
jgi:N-acyl-D-amino-acid deacylase